VIVRKGLFKSAEDVILVTSFADTTAKQLTGYKIFRDMLGRTHYKRLSAPNTTELAEYLSLGDTTITVKDSSVLTPGNPARNIPGVIFIDKERIEFFTISGNELGQLRRGTLGTAPKDIYAPGTPVMDQGTLQTVPFKETVQSTSTYTTTSTATYSILSGYIKFNTDATDYYNQIEVRYNGKPLLKPHASITTQHIIESSYDSMLGNTLTDVVVQPGFDIQNTTTVVLNFTPANGARLEVIKRTSHIWYDNTNSSLSLMDNSTVQANFLSETGASLPFLPPLTPLSSLVLFTELGEPIDNEGSGLDPLLGA
jgi:hypothetical protein